MSNRRRDTLPKTSKNATGGSASQRRVSRREREDRQRKQLYIGLAIAALLSVAIVSGFALYEYVFKPRAVLASVNGVEIRRRDYWKVRSVDLINQVNQYNQFSQMVDASQSQQYITLAQQAADELDGVWGSTSIDDATLTRMVEDQVYLQSLDGLGLEVTDQDEQNYLNTQFQPSNAPIFTPTPSPTLIPQRAEWATQTETALRAEEEEPTEDAASPVDANGSPISQASPVDAGSPIGSPQVASPVVDASPVVVGSPIASPQVASPVVDASPVVVGSPIASPQIASPVIDASPVVVGSPIASPKVASPIVDASPVVVGSPIASPQIASPVVVPSSAAGSPVSDASPSAVAMAPTVVEGSPEVASPMAAGSPVAGSPDTIASPAGSPEATATSADAATPNPTEAVQTAEAGYGDYADVVFDIAHLSNDDYLRLVVRPAVARQKVDDYLLKDVGQTTAQVHASHILVDTKDLADSIYAQLQGGADFAQTAMEQSNDTGTAENGGDLGWFTKGQMVEPFENVAFSLQPGEISQPFQTQFGWHIVKVLETDPNRAMTDQQLQQYRDSIVSRWLAGQKATMDISSKVEPTPTPALSSFVPPPDAPPLPTVTALPTEVAADASPVGSPIGSSEASPIASPPVVPVASPSS